MPPIEAVEVRTTLLRALLLGLVFLQSVMANAAAPLHRCALEDWPAENYHAYVFHEGPLDPADQELVEVLASAPPKLGLNLLVSTVDTLEEMEPSVEALWLAQTNAASPWLVVTSPRRDLTNAPVWSTALRTTSVGAILASPARRSIAESLLEGTSAVWLLVECGDTVRDEAAVDLLAGELKRLEKQLPTPKRNPAAPLRSALPLTPHFSLIRVTRIDSAEELLLNTLLTPEPALLRPIVIPIFGRGRVLPALTGRHLNEEAIGRSCALLLGDCTNVVRDTTSGSELLLGGHWNSIFEERKPVASSRPEMTNATAPSVISFPPDTAAPTNTAIAQPSSTLPEARSFGSFAAALVLAAVVGFAVVKVWKQR